MPDEQSYNAQLHEKCARVQELLSPYTKPEPSIYPSQERHFRMRAEFRLWHEGDACFYVMFPPGKAQQPYRVHQLPMASRTINRLMPLLIEFVEKHKLLREKLFQVEFLSTLAGDCLLTLIYHKPLDDAWLALARPLSESLGVELIGRSRGQKIVLNNDFIIETLHINSRPYRYQQIENSFTQPNASVNEKMLEWAQNCTQRSNGDLLELYCGNGNFSIVLAQNFRRVFATEISKSGLNAARFNATENSIANFECARLSAAEAAQAIRGEREFRRLQHINVADYQFDTLLVDPPRSGLDAETLSFAGEFKRIVYISCNPQSLAENLKPLIETHDISHFAIFDQFPFTPHIESGVILEAR